MGETFRTLLNGEKLNNDGEILDEELGGLPILCARKTLTGTQLQSLNTTPIAVVTNPTGKVAVPIGWYCKFDHAGGTDFSGNATIQLCSVTSANVLGSATNAISGSTDKCTTGTIATGACDADADGLMVKVGTGDPTGGHATASLIVQVWYVFI